MSWDFHDGVDILTIFQITQSECAYELCIIMLRSSIISLTSSPYSLHVDLWDVSWCFLPCFKLCITILQTDPREMTIPHHHSLQIKHFPVNLKIKPHQLPSFNYCRSKSSQRISFCCPNITIFITVTISLYDDKKQRVG